MIPWNRLPKDVAKSLLVMIVLSGGAATSACCPVICDPAPPPPTAPKGTTPMTPMICDPPPPPAITRSPTSRASITPMICDPAPPPPGTIQSRPPVTPATLQHFRLHSLRMIVDETLGGAGIQGTVSVRMGLPLSGIEVRAQTDATMIKTWTDRNGAFFLRLPATGLYTVSVGADQSNAPPLTLYEHDVAVVEWLEVAGESQSSLPLAEIRTVDLVGGHNLAFSAESPWPQARYRWSVSGGRLAGSGEQVVWEPATEPGRYLLQVIADWGRSGLAVDSVVLIVHDDGTISVS